MQTYSGKSIYKGTAIGKIFFYHKNEQNIERTTVEYVEEEIARFENAKMAAKEQLIALSERITHVVGESNALIFDIHAIIADDENITDSIINVIRTEQVNAEYAVTTVADELAAEYAAMEDDFFKARSSDIRDVTNRILRILTGANNTTLCLDEPVIIVAKDLSPSETISLDKSKLLSFVTEQGSSISHTAILARAMGLPSLIGVEIDESWDGHIAIVDGNSAQLIVDPDEETLEKYRTIVEQENSAQRQLFALKELPDETPDGHSIYLYANITSLDDIDSVIESGASGIGLMRSEFLYLGRDLLPTEEEQFNVYKAVACKMAGKKVVIRTLDIHDDKMIDCVDFDYSSVFQTQLRAIYRASAFGNISVMFPMISSVDEVRRLKTVCEEVKASLANEGIPYKDVEIGIMIETPAAVMVSDELAKEVDFFSIGTNDLTYYTLNLDRHDPEFDTIVLSHRDEILRMIETVVKNGHCGNCWVGICGELASDTTLTEQFIQMGIDELSVSTSFVLSVRKAIRGAK